MAGWYCKDFGHSYFRESFLFPTVTSARNILSPLILPTNFAERSGSWQTKYDFNNLLSSVTIGKVGNLAVVNSSGCSLKYARTIFRNSILLFWSGVLLPIKPPYSLRLLKPNKMNYILRITPE